MFRSLIVLSVLAVAGCRTVDPGMHHPKTDKEKKAFARANLETTPEQVRKDFESLRNTEVAWAGIIRDVQYKETERTIQVAFKVEHRYFDWMDYGGAQPFHLSTEGEGMFVAGWPVNKPTRIGYLKALVKPGDMLIVYGKPYSVFNNIVHLAASAIRPVKAKDYAETEVSAGLEESVPPPDEE